MSHRLHDYRHRETEFGLPGIYYVIAVTVVLEV